MVRSTFRFPCFVRALALVALGAGVPAWAQGAVSAEAETATGSDALTLDVLFDEDGHFGKAARAMTISADGRFGAFAWAPFAERRHGGDLHIVDLATGDVRRVTQVSVMAPFDADAREVGRDRIAKAEAEAAAKRKAKGAEDARGEGADSEGKTSDGAKSKGWSELAKRAGGDAAKGKALTDARMDIVQDGDAQDEDAPRYGGVSEIVWAPEAAELLFTSGGDVYRYVPGAEEGTGITRLTKTRGAERNAQYLPGGAGYTALAGDALIEVRFGDHFANQLDPELPDGMTMRRYAMSEDGRRLVFVASNTSRGRSGGRTVDIATYRDRFMKVRTVPRTVSDDPVRKTDSAVFLYELPRPELENGRLVRVYQRTTTGPRDVLELPDWAPDGSRVTFAVFDQASSEVHVLEAVFPEDDTRADDAADAGSGTGEREASGATKGRSASAKSGKRTKADGEDFEDVPARVVKRLLHTGGPNTPRMIDPRYLADSRRIVLLSEVTGFRQLHLLDPLYEALEPLTTGRYEVYPIGMPKDRSCLWVEATREDPARVDVYRVALPGGEMQRLTPARGLYAGAAVAPDGSKLLANYTAFGAPRELVLVDVAKGEQAALTDSHDDAADRIAERKPEFFDFENRHGQRIHGFVMEPERSARDERRPLLVYVYGGPLGTRKQVYEGNLSGSAYRFARYMTEEHGWVTATIDPRGMSGYGAKYEKANFERVGQPQVEDLVDGVAALVERYGADADRVALHGWSFGGFQTQMCLYTEPEVFRCGIAGAGPTEWENYNSWYSTGTIGESREGKTDLAEYSLLPLAKNLQRKLLLVHGMEDANVLYQDTVRVYAELLDAGKETLVELFVDPTGEHHLDGHVKSLGMYRKYEEFLLRCNVAPADAAGPGADAADE